MSDNKMSIVKVNRVLRQFAEIKDRMITFKVGFDTAGISLAFFEKFNPALDIITALEPQLEKELGITLGENNDYR